MKLTYTILATSVITVLAGCADTPRADAAYGDAVRHMVEAQTLDPLAASSATGAAAQEGDGQRVEQAVKTYRGDVSKGAAEVKQDLIINVGR
jgi:hypothetical protein